MSDSQLVSHFIWDKRERVLILAAIEGFRVAEKALEEWKKEGKVKAKL
jgi:hypothetical protein